MQQLSERGRDRRSGHEVTAYGTNDAGKPRRTLMTDDFIHSLKHELMKSFFNEFLQDGEEGWVEAGEGEEEDEKADDQDSAAAYPLLYPTPPGERLDRFFGGMGAEGVGLRRGVELMEHGIKGIDASIFGGYALFLLLLPLLEALFLLAGDVAVDGTLFLAHLASQGVDVGGDSFGDVFLLLFGGCLLLGDLREDDRHDAVCVDGGMPYPTLDEGCGGSRV